MTLIGILQLSVWLFLIPAAAGILFYNPYKGKGRILFMWVCGQMLLWAVFFLVCIPFIVTMQPLRKMVYAYCLTAAVILLISVFWGARGLIKRQKTETLRLVRNHAAKRKLTPEKIFLFLFLLVLALQFVMAVSLAYRDGDDAFYVAVAEIAEESDLMYLKNVYSFGNSGLDYRRAIAPFPMWIAFLSRISGIKAVITAHVVVSATQILMGNIILFLIGGRLFKDGRKYFFIFTSQVLLLFGDYSIYTTERFLIARSRQGKAALGAILIPMFYLFFLLLSECVRNKKKIPLSLWGLLLCIQISILLCSTQGALLSGLLAVILGVCTAAAYRRWKLVLPFILSCIPAVVVFLVYLVKKL